MLNQYTFGLLFFILFLALIAMLFFTLLVFLALEPYVSVYRQDMPRIIAFTLAVDHNYTKTTEQAQ